MNTLTLLIAAAIALPAVALSGWVWFSVMRIDKQLLAGFEGMHFEI